MKKVYKLVSFFAGVGGIDLGFQQTERFETIYANEIDPYPIKTFEKNFKLKVDNRDIHLVEAKDIPNCDIIVGGFPCQAFSIAGHRQGFDDAKGRGTLFFEMMRLVDSKKPNVVLFENVKNLVGHDEGNTFNVIIKKLKESGYFIRYKVLNAMEYGNTPQNRERIYIVGFLNENHCQKFKFPEPENLTTKLSDIIDFKNKLDDKYYYLEGKYKDNIYQQVTKEVNDSNFVYQWRRQYVRKNMSNVVPTLTANMGEGGHNVPLIYTKYGVRKLTPHECFNAQGFPKNFLIPNDVAESRLYKQAGNSVCVNVIKRIAEAILDAIEN